MEEKKELPKKVFIVDDDSFLLEMYVSKFKEKGFQVTEASGSIDALNKLKEGATPDVILLDIVIPAMDGFELLSLIKSENLAPQAKIIVLSNLGQATDVQRGRDLGANGYIIKASSTPSEVVVKVLAVMQGEELFPKLD